MPPDTRRLSPALIRAKDSQWRRRAHARRSTTESQTGGSQFVVAVFDDWDALHAILLELESDKVAHPVALLHARRDVPPKVSASSLLEQMTELHFERSHQHIACTMGQLAEAIATRLTGGARTLADALHDWLGSNQAKQLESHLERGHLVLSVELRTSDDFSVVCGRLVHASPHKVELCNINFKPSCRARS